jgi:endonuclease/exonuclease/phosphatase family metal-dependent hydrolase
VPAGAATVNRWCIRPVCRAGTWQSGGVRVVTWNVQTARPNPDGPPDVDAAIARLRALDADVYALQELDRTRPRSGGVDQPTAIAEGLDGTLVWAPTVHDGGQYGIALVVRGDVVREHEVGLSGTREPRTLIVAEVDHGGRRWVVGCTHLSRNRRFAQRQLLRALDELSARPGPRVLLGDLNLAPADVLPWSTAAGYRLLDGAPTHSTRQRRVTVRIDHVLTSGARVAEASVHDLGMSDHRAVSARLA